MNHENPLNRHLHEVDETYFEHMAFASKIGFRLFIGGIGCMLHGIFPFLCEKTGSNTIFTLHDEVLARRKACEERRLKDGG